ncbi:MAG: hypothetical protein ACP5QR_16090 [Rhizomicrobium sp.]
MTDNGTSAEVGNDRLRGTQEARPSRHRITWPLGSDPQAKTLRGATLLQWLVDTANEQGLQLNQVAARLGCTYGYLHQLRKGMKPVPGISEQLIDACTEFLGVPRLAVMMAADIIKPTDFYADAELTNSSLDATLRLIRSDPQWGPRMSPAIFDLDDRGKLFVVNLYEKARGVQLLFGRANIDRYVAIMTNEEDEGTPANDA